MSDLSLSSTYQPGTRAIFLFAGQQWEFLGDPSFLGGNGLRIALSNDLASFSLGRFPLKSLQESRAAHTREMEIW